MSDENLPVTHSSDGLPAEQPVKMIEVPEHMLETLLELKKDLQRRVDEFEDKEERIANACLKAMTVLGLIDPKTGRMVDALTNSESSDSVISFIFDALKEQISISDLLFNKKKAAAELMKKFSFFTDLMPIIQDYANRKLQQRPALRIEQGD